MELLKYNVFTWPNILSFFRIFVTPIIIYFLMLEQYNIAIFFFLLAAFSDFLDGFCARYLKQETIFGAYLDPLADKIFLVSLAFFLTKYHINTFQIPLWFFYILFIREFVQIIVAGALYYYKGPVVIIKPSIISKINTCIIMALLFFVLSSTIFNTLHPFFCLLLPFLIMMATLLTIVSFFQYSIILLKNFYLK